MVNYDTLLVTICREFPLVTLIGENKYPAISATDYNFGCLTIDTIGHGGDTSNSGKNGVHVTNVGSDTLHIYGWQLTGLNISDYTAAQYFEILSPPDARGSAHAYALAPDSSLAFAIRVHPNHSFPEYDTAILVYANDAFKFEKDTSYLSACALTPSGIARQINSPAPLQQPSLSQNAPNPFSEVSDILISLPAGSHARLTILNELGDIVATPTDGVLSQGDHTVHVDATNLPSGFYYYRLQTNAGTVLKTMAIVK